MGYRDTNLVVVIKLNPSLVAGLNAFPCTPFSTRTPGGAGGPQVTPWSLNDGGHLKRYTEEPMSHLGQGRSVVSKLAPISRAPQPRVSVNIIPSDVQINPYSTLHMNTVNDLTMDRVARSIDPDDATDEED